MSRKKTGFLWRIQIKTSPAISTKIRTTKLLFSIIINIQRCSGFSMQCNNTKRTKRKGKPDTQNYKEEDNVGITTRK